MKARVIILIIILFYIFTYISPKEYFRQELKQDQPPFSEVIGRYVILTHPTKLDTDTPLNIAEIEVYEQGTNTRLKGGANNKVSSVLPAYPISNLEDGNVNTFAITSDAKPWMLVDLGSDKKIQKVVIQNRRDCCKERIVGANFIIVDQANGTDIINRLNNEKDITTGYVYRSGFNETKNTYEFNVKDWKKPMNKIDCIIGDFGACVADTSLNPSGDRGYKYQQISTPASGGGICSGMERQFCWMANYSDVYSPYIGFIPGMGDMVYD